MPKPVIPKPALNRINSIKDQSPFTLVDFDPLEVARQLTLMESNIFASIEHREFLDLSWMKEDKELKAPNLLRLIRWNNHVVNWQISEILIQKDVKVRATVIERIIMVAQVRYLY